jgi:hypothetical protein
MSQYEYEFIFTGDYDESVFTSAPIDKSESLKDSVVDEVSKIKHILSLYNGINIMSSTVQSQNKTYKVTLKRT